MAISTCIHPFTPTIETRILDFIERPTCQKCGSLKNICSHSKPSLVTGLEEKYYIVFKEYTCTNKACSEYKKHKVRSLNPYRAARHRFDYEIESVICQQRFKYYRNYREIKNHLEFNHGVSVSQKTIGNIIKGYEFSCKMHGIDQVFKELKKNGGAFIHIDAMAPLKGESKHVVAMDHFTRRIVLVEKVKSETTKNHVKIQQKLKKLLKCNNIEVLGFMSDDHRAQRKAIKEVWGKKMKHSRCLFHFTKRILNKPFELNRTLLAKARSKLRKIYPVKCFREEKGVLTGKGRVSNYLNLLTEDLSELSNWKNKPNDTELNSLLFYERMQDIHETILLLKEYIAKNPKIKLKKKEITVLTSLDGNLKVILEENKSKYDELTRIKKYYEKVRVILEAHKESSKIGLKKMKKLVKELQLKTRSPNKMGAVERDFIHQLATFILDRGKSLFHYRDIENAPTTNNLQENRFKELKYQLKRTLGKQAASKYLQTHGENLFYVDPNASLEEIKEILMTADHEKIRELMKQEREARKKKRLAKIKNDEKWEAIKEDYDKKLQEII